MKESTRKAKKCRPLRKQAERRFGGNLQIRHKNGCLRPCLSENFITPKSKNHFVSFCKFARRRFDRASVPAPVSGSLGLNGASEQKHPGELSAR